MSADIETVVVGAGIVGLAIDRALAAKGQGVVVLERNGRTGAHGLRVLPLEVPSVAETAPAPPPAFTVPQGPWLVLREAPRPGRRTVDFQAGEKP